MIEKELARIDTQWVKLVDYTTRNDADCKVEVDQTWDSEEQITKDDIPLYIAHADENGYDAFTVRTAPS